jgi:LPXTG-motif cell wall-anchored protein
MVKRLVIVGVVVLTALAAPAAAQQYPPAVNSLTVSDTTPTPGQTISIEGRTFAAGATATVALTTVTLGSPTADAAGVIRLDAIVPADTTLGSHTLTATGPAPDGTTLSLSLALNVVAADGSGSGAGSGPLPNTGSDSSLPLAQVGLGLAAFGGVVVALAGRRRRSLSRA